MNDPFITITPIVENEYDGDFHEYLVRNDSSLEAIDVYLETCDEQVFKKAQEVCHDYFGLNVPIDLLRKVFKHNPQIAYENSLGSVRDTYVRDILADALMGVMMVPRWPFNGDSDEYVNVWRECLKQQMPKYGVTFCQ